VRVEPHDGLYRLTRLASNFSEESKLAPEEAYALNYLFENGPITEISPSMAQENSARNSRYVANIQQDLTERFGGVYFTRHIGYVAIGVLATFVVAFSLAATAQGRDPSAALFMTAWILFCALTLGAIVEVGLLPAWKGVVRGTAQWIKMLPGTAAAGVFVFFPAGTGTPQGIRSVLPRATQISLFGHPAFSRIAARASSVAPCSLAAAINLCSS